MVDTCSKFLPGNRAAMTGGSFSLLRMQTGARPGPLGFAGGAADGGSLEHAVHRGTHASSCTRSLATGRARSLSLSVTHHPDSHLCQDSRLCMAPTSNPTTTGFSNVEIFRKYLWFLLRERSFDEEALADLVALKAALGLSDEQVRLGSGLWRWAAGWLGALPGAGARVWWPLRGPATGSPRHTQLTALPPQAGGRGAAGAGAARVREVWHGATLGGRAGQGRLGGASVHVTRLPPPATCPLSSRHEHHPATDSPPHKHTTLPPPHSTPPAPQVMVNMQGMSQSGVERKAAARNLFIKLLSLTEARALLSGEAAAGVDLGRVFGVTQRDILTLRSGYSAEGDEGQGAPGDAATDDEDEGGAAA